MVFDGESAEGVRESLCTLGNGYLATRGAAPEHRADGVHYPGTYLAGCYNRLRDTVHGEAVETESMVNIPNWMPMTMRIGDGPWLGQAGLDLVEERYELDLRGGQLTRQFQVRDAQSRVATVTQRRLVHRRLPNVCGLQTTVTPHGWSGDITFSSTVDPTVENRGVLRYQGLSSRHLSTPLRAERVDERDRAVRGRDQSVTHQDRRGGPHPSVRFSGRMFATRRTHRWLDWPGVDGCGRRQSAGHGGEDRDSALFTRRRDLRARRCRVGTAGGAARLRRSDRRHTLAWRQIWQRFHVDLTGGGLAVAGESVLRMVRLHLFHVLQTVSVHGVDGDVGVPARGLHGEAYRGHILWDELFVLPMLSLRLPEVSRALLLYRYRRLRGRAAGGRAGGSSRRDVSVAVGQLRS